MSLVKWLGVGLLLVAAAVYMAVVGAMAVFVVLSSRETTD